MRTAFNDFFYEKRGIYGVLHVMILLLSLFLIVDISIDTFNNIQPQQATRGARRLP